MCGKVIDNDYMNSCDSARPHHAGHQSRRLTSIAIKILLLQAAPCSDALRKNRHTHTAVFPTWCCGIENTERVLVGMEAVSVA